MTSTPLIIDSGVANLRSVLNALRYLGAEPHIASAPGDVRAARKIILPGVGAFGAAMHNLRTDGYIEPLRDAAALGTPILGICLGMQLLFQRSHEMGTHEGLGLLPGEVVRFPAGRLKVPHVGWNRLTFEKSAGGDSPLLHGIADGGYAYFVHSYYAQPAAPGLVLASVEYGVSAPAIVGQGRVFGAQFHPEKSQAVGLALLRNFLLI
jgi:glutamine amidotransferase